MKYELDSVQNMDAWEFIKELPDKSVDVVITDPDYNSPFYLDEVERVCKGNIVVFCSPERQFFIADEYLFWVKTPSTKNYVNHCGRFVEIILVKRQGPTFNQLYWSQMTGVYDDRLVYVQYHPFEKPATLIERLLRIYSNQGDIILDPFTGSGTVPFACCRLNRHFIANDHEKKWTEFVRKWLPTYERQRNPN